MSLELHGNNLLTGLGVGARRWGQRGRQGADQHTTVHYSMYKLNRHNSSSGGKVRVMGKGCLSEADCEPPPSQ